MNDFEKTVKEALHDYGLVARDMIITSQNQYERALAAILAAHKKEVARVIGEDERAARTASPLEKQLFPEYNRIDHRNVLRKEQRTRAGLK